MVGKLKAKRFGQIYEYLDQGGAGDLDLITLVRNNSATVSFSSPPHHPGAHNSATVLSPSPPRHSGTRTLAVKLGKLDR